MFNFLNFSAFGLDISDRLIKVAQFIQNRNQLNLFTFGSHEVPPGIINKGEIEKAEELAEIIKKTLAETQPYPIKSKYAVCCLPESKCFIRLVKLPQMNPSEIAEAAGWEAEEQFPLKKEEMYLDWQILKPIEESNLKRQTKEESKKSSSTDILLVAASKNSVDSYLATFDKAGLVPVVLEPESIAIIRSLINQKKNLGAVMIIDLGQERTGFIIYKEPAIKFTSDIPISGNLLTKAVAKEFKVSFKEAEKIKIDCGLNKTKKNGRVIKAILPYLSQLAKKIDQSLAYYYSEHFDSLDKSRAVSKIILCGGGANLKGLSVFLSLQLKREVEIGNPCINFIKPQLKKLPSISHSKSLAYVTAFGLALRGIQNY